MLTIKQLNIFGLYSKKAFSEVTFKEFKEQSGENSNSLVQNAIGKFIREELIIQRSIGNSKLYRLNHDNPIIYNYLGMYCISVLPKPAIKSILLVKEAVEKEELFYSLVVFGSYANNNYSNKSDIDIAIFLPKENKKKRIEILLNSVSNRSLIEIDCHIISSKEFNEMLKADYENLGKEVVSNNLPIINPSIFYSLILNAIRNGYNPLS
ncbi:MAG: nucleotidyltransferase domain-containing protein [Candidatus Woesearchaeota archaeon]